MFCLAGKRVTREQLEQLMEAANWAPNHNLNEPWRYVVTHPSAGSHRACM